MSLNISLLDNMLRAGDFAHFYRWLKFKKCFYLLWLFPQKKCTKPHWVEKLRIVVWAQFSEITSDTFVYNRTKLKDYSEIKLPLLFCIKKAAQIKRTIMNRAASEDSQELLWWQVAKNANICLKTLADPTMNTTSFISSTTRFRNSVKSSPSSSKPGKKNNVK